MSTFFCQIECERLHSQEKMILEFKILRQPTLVSNLANPNYKVIWIAAILLNLGLKALPEYRTFLTYHERALNTSALPNGLK
jgi:hypothetical protein